MPPQPIIDLDSIDTSSIYADKDVIRSLNPQRYEMEQLDGIFSMDADNGVCVGFRDVAEDEWWVRGHIPDRPLFPGVLMIEAAAQLASYMTHCLSSASGFMGFAGVEEAKFRGVVTPPSRIILIGKALSLKPRRFSCYVQGYVDGKLVYEVKVLGMSL